VRFIETEVSSALELERYMGESPQINPDRAKGREISSQNNGISVLVRSTRQALFIMALNRLLHAIVHLCANVQGTGLHNILQALSDLDETRCAMTIPRSASSALLSHPLKYTRTPPGREVISIESLHEKCCDGESSLAHPFSSSGYWPFRGGLKPSQGAVKLTTLFLLLCRPRVEKEWPT
jgi:hypothetical protein